MRGDKSSSVCRLRLPETTCLPSDTLMQLCGCINANGALWLTCSNARDERANTNVRSARFSEDVRYLTLLLKANEQDSVLMRFKDGGSFVFVPRPGNTNVNAHYPTCLITVIAIMPG